VLRYLGNRYALYRNFRKADLAALEACIAPLQSQIDRLSRQFWVTKAQVKGNKYDLSASRYRQSDQDEAYYESPQVTMERLLVLERVMTAEIEALREDRRDLSGFRKPDRSAAA